MNYVIQGISKRKYSIIDSDKQPRHPKTIMIGKLYDYKFCIILFVCMPFDQDDKLSEP